VAGQTQSGEPVTLSKRQTEVLERVAAGLTDKEISDDLAISESAVRAHVRECDRKLGGNNRSHAVALAIERGLITRRDR
jgi:DNA-binding CsgD family transcriptional regulator